MPAKSKDLGKIIWWGHHSFEIQTNNHTIIFDPLFRIYRKADYILCSNQFTDHCNLPTQERILDISPNFKYIIQPKNASTQKRFKKYLKILTPGKIYEDEFFWIKGLYGFEFTKYDLAFLVKDKKNNIFFLHGGDANSGAFKSIEAAFKSIYPQRVDYYFPTLGKITIAEIKKLLIAFQPNYIIPGHYPVKIKDLWFNRIVEFPNEYKQEGNDNIKRYVRPPFDIDFFKKEILNCIKKNKLKSKLIILKPGQELELQ